MKLGELTITLDPTGTTARYVVAGRVYGVETLLTPAQLDAHIADLTREAARWRAARGEQKEGAS